MKALILGIGNVLLHDEGLGVLALEELGQRFSFPEGVELVDGGTCGMELRERLCDRDLLIILDAMKNGGPPGTAYRLESGEVPTHFLTRISPNQLGISDVLSSLVLTGSLPPALILLGVEPEDLSIGLGLSPAVKSGMSKVITAVVEELSRRGLQPLSLDSSRSESFWVARH